MGGGGGFFQAEDGIRDLVRSRGLGDVYKRQPAGVKKIQDLYKENVNAFSTIISPAIFKKSSQFGEMMGKAIHDYSMTDGQDEAYPVSYTHLRAPRDRTRSRMPSSA